MSAVGIVMPSYSEINVVGLPVAVINMAGAVSQIRLWLEEKRVCRTVSLVDVHCLMQSHRRPEVRKAFCASDVRFPDGMPLTWVARIHGHRTMGRVYGPDLMLSVLALAAEEGYSSVFIGGAPGVAEELRRRMMDRNPGLRVLGTFSPPFRPLSEIEKDEFAEQIDGLRPDLVWVGLGAPKQDLFMAEFKARLAPTVMIGVGAAFDFHSGRVRQAPRWMMRAGLEWFFRLCMEPRRLAPRYLRNIPAFLFHLFLQEAGLRRYPQEKTQV